MNTAMSRRVGFLLMGSMFFLAGWLTGQQGAKTEKTTVHAMAWTMAEGATEQDFENFKRATEEFLMTMPGLKRAWVGKLRKPLVVGDITRTHGTVLEFDDLKSKEAYPGHASRVPWAAAFSKVRVPSSTYFDLIGE